MLAHFLFLVVDTVPEFLLKDEDEDEIDDDIDIDVDPCTLSPSCEPPWPLMSSASKNDSIPAIGNILPTFTGTLRHCGHYIFFFIISANSSFSTGII